MPYGREMLEASWEWNWDTHPIYKIMREDTIDLDALSPLLTEYNCQYLILNKSVPYTGDPQKNGLTKIADIEAYELYRNEAVEPAQCAQAPGFYARSIYCLNTFPKRSAIFSRPFWFR